MRITYTKDQWFIQIKQNYSNLVKQSDCGLYEASKNISYSHKDFNKMKLRQKEEIQRNRFQSIQKQDSSCILMCFQKNSRLKAIQKIKAKQKETISKKSIPSQTKEQAKCISNKQTAHTSRIQRQSHQKMFGSANSSIFFTQNDLSFESSNFEQQNSEQIQQSQCSKQQIFDKKISQILFKQQSSIYLDDIFKKIKISDYLNEQNPQQQKIN